ncbi:hypothetical protein LZ31DRAFT_486258, partial [Colletotrichum somersetense]
MSKERTRPFHFHRKPATEKRYTQVVFQLFSYIVRVMTIEAEERPPFRFTTRQQEAFDSMMKAADKAGEELAKAQGDTEGVAAKAAMDRLEEGVASMFLSVLDHQTKGTEYDSILVSFFMVLSIRADYGWEDFSSFTPKLSAITTMARLFVVKSAVDQRIKAVAR